MSVNYVLHISVYMVISTMAPMDHYAEALDQQFLFVYLNPHAVDHRPFPWKCLQILIRHRGFQAVLLLRPTVLSRLRT